MFVHLMLEVWTVQRKFCEAENQRVQEVATRLTNECSSAMICKLTITEYKYIHTCNKRRPAYVAGLSQFERWDAEKLLHELLECFCFGAI